MKPNTSAVSKHVPNDLVFSILSKLPLKSLKRFSYTCKSWTHLLEDTRFMNMFRNNFLSRWHSYYDDSCLLLKHADEDGDVMYLLSGENMVKLDWPPLLRDEIFVNSPVLMLGSAVNGTLCLYTYRDNYNKIVLWNPTTQEFKLIPPALCEEGAENHRFPLVYGFGYDQIRDDYKVIQYNLFIDTHFTWEIYSLRSNSWRKLRALDNVGTIVAGTDVYLNGMCHWLAETSHWYDKTTYAIESNAYLLSFDLSNEVVLTTPLPIKSVSGPTYQLQTHLLNGSIAFISNSEYFTTTFHISVLDELGVKGSWTKLFTVGPLPGLERPVGIGRKGEILFKRDREMVLFDLNTQMIKEVGVKEAYSCCAYCRCQTVICKKSLHPIGGINN